MNPHDAIMASYEKRRTNSIKRLESRKSEVYAKIPQLLELDRQIVAAGLDCSKRILNGTAVPDLAACTSKLENRLHSLKFEKAALLLSNNLPADYLDITYECPKCSDTGYIGTAEDMVKCPCYHQQLLDLLFSQSNLKLTEKENFAAFNDKLYPDVIDEPRYGLKISPRANIGIIKQRCLKFIANIGSPEERNLFFSGPAGTGKTFMCNCIAAEVIKQGITVLYQTSPVLFSTIAQFKQKAVRDGYFKDDAYDRIFDAELLIIDDLGTEPPSPARYAEFLTILDTRRSNGLSRICKTIISTNISPRELYEYYDERSASRIIGGFDMLRFAGEDIRRFR